MVAQEREESESVAKRKTSTRDARVRGRGGRRQLALAAASVDDAGARSRRNGFAPTASSAGEARVSTGGGVPLWRLRRNHEALRLAKRSAVPSKTKNAPKARAGEIAVRLADHVVRSPEPGGRRGKAKITVWLIVDRWPSAKDR